MKSGSRAKAAEGSRTAELRRSLEEAGWRFTRQRAPVYDYLQAAQINATGDVVSVG